MKKHTRLLFAVIFVFSLLGEVATAVTGRVSTTVSPYFGSHMVLQREMKVPVWGTAAAGTVISVSFNGQSINTVAGANGTWLAKLAAMPANDLPGTLLVSGGGKTFTFSDVLVGEVWVLSGQSNMNILLRDSIGGADAVATSGDFPNISLYMTWISGNGTTGTWLPSNPGNSQYWSAVGFYFARALSEQITGSIPIGLIQVAKNGISIADWTTFGGSRGKLYKDNVVPIQPYAIRGVLWYQGETEADPLSYYRMLPGLIGNWRADWGQGNFPFYFVQLAPISGRPNYAIIRDAQVATLDVTENTGMACIIDIPTVPTTEIHPKDKEPVGQRLALIARAQLYGEPDLV